MNKESRREREQMERESAMIDAAEQLFCRNGYERTSMDDLAKETEFTKRTLYRYFTGKEDLFFAVALKGYRLLREKMHSKKNKGETGYDKICMAYEAFVEFYNESPALLTIILMKSAIETNADNTDVPYRAKFTEMDGIFFNELVELFIEGQRDGSIRADVDVAQLALSTIFMAIGFFHLFTLSGDIFTRHFELDKDGFVHTSIKMQLENLRNPNEQTHTADIK